MLSFLCLYNKKKTRQIAFGKSTMFKWNHKASFTHRRLCVNEIIRHHLHIVDLHTAIWQVFLSFRFLGWHYKCYAKVPIRQLGLSFRVKLWHFPTDSDLRFRRDGMDNKILGKKRTNFWLIQTFLILNHGYKWF